MTILGAKMVRRKYRADCVDIYALITSIAREFAPSINEFWKDNKVKKVTKAIARTNVVRKVAYFLDPFPVERSSVRRSPSLENRGLNRDGMAWTHHRLFPDRAFHGLPLW